MNCKICDAPEMEVAFALRDYDILECKACGFRCIPYMDVELDANPAASIVTDADVAEAERYAKKNLEHNATKLRQMVAMLEETTTAGSKVLDVGCGSGHFLAAIANTYEATGIELSPVRFKLCKRRNLNVSMYPLNSDYWDGQLGTFGAVTLWDVIEHVNQPKLIAKRAFELLKPGGVLLMDTPSRDGVLYKAGELTARLTGGRYPTTMAAQYSPTPFNHKQIFRLTDMRSLLEEIGFQVDLRTRTELSMPGEFYISAMSKSKQLGRVIGPVADAAISVVPLNNKMIVMAMRPSSAIA